MNSRAIARTNGSLALDNSGSALRVIEGGLRARQRQQHTAMAQAKVFCVALVMVLAVGAFWRHIDIAAQKNREQHLSEASTEVITVMPGDSLWNIAATHPVSGCTTSQVARHIASANGLDSNLLTVGMQLEVPQTILVS